MSNNTADDLDSAAYRPIDSTALPIAVERALMRVISPPTATDKKDAIYYKKKARANNTYRSYASAIRDFVNWTQHPNPFPTTSFLIERYLIAMANAVNDAANSEPQQNENATSRKYAPSTISHRLAALSWLHRMLGFDDPTQNTQIRRLLTGIRKDCVEDGWQERQAPALSFEALRAMLTLMGESLRDCRDRAFILTSVFGALRQSEAVTLDCSQLNFEARGIVIRLGKTKTDQLQSRKQYSALPCVGGLFCPATALQAWLTRAQITEGPVFRGINRHGQFVMKKIHDEQGVETDKKPTPLSHTSGNRIVKEWVKKAGIDHAENYSGHSLRATFVTLSRSLGIPDALIVRQTHHRNLNMLNIYDRPDQVLQDSPTLTLLDHFKQYSK